jgi:hypothetical protein
MLAELTGFLNVKAVHADCQGNLTRARNVPYHSSNSLAVNRGQVFCLVG